jgi:hypothetical protein
MAGLDEGRVALTREYGGWVYLIINKPNGVLYTGEKNVKHWSRNGHGGRYL